MATTSSSCSSLGSSSCFLGQKLLSTTTTSTTLPSAVKFRRLRLVNSAESTRSSRLCSSNMISPASLYEVLGIPSEATHQEIRTAYRQLARVCHPDAVATDRKDKSTGEFIKINAAYSTLADPQKRADYDQELFSRQRLHRFPSGFSVYTRRNWETDQCW